MHVGVIAASCAPSPHRRCAARLESRLTSRSVSRLTRARCANCETIDKAIANRLAYVTKVDRIDLSDYQQSMSGQAFNIRLAIFSMAPSSCTPPNLCHIS